VGSFFELSPEEQIALFEIVGEQKRVPDAEFSPHAFNIGINDGPAAGQTVAHLHVHLIPAQHGRERDILGGLHDLYELARRANSKRRASTNRKLESGHPVGLMVIKL
jgi:diadenosine tetraphosphate (Ap4A) HIT family hydrolase